MVFRRRRPSPPDPFAALDVSSLPARYQPPVDDALRARVEFRRMVESLEPGPAQERLREVAIRVDDSTRAVWDTAWRAAEMERVVATLDPDRVTAELKQARRSGADPELVEALTARFTSVQRLLDALDHVRERLPVLEARLGAAVARAAELSLISAASASSDVNVIDAELQSLVTDLEALRLASLELH
jgi:hypothetical protein